MIFKKPEFKHKPKLLLFSGSDLCETMYPQRIHRSLKSVLVSRIWSYFLDGPVSEAD